MYSTFTLLSDSFRIISFKFKSYITLMKLRLSLLVVFSAGIGYFLGIKGSLNVELFLIFSLAGLLLTIAGNIINQIIEKDSDKLMQRTMYRPLPTASLSVKEAFGFALFCFFISMFLFLYFINVKTASVAFLSFILYSFAYTPLKTKHPIAVFVGALPGALPPMIGWLGATSSFGLEPGILFAIQFVWQFPHFWAIAWVLDDDYKKAGIRLLPGSGQDIRTAFQIMIYTLFLIPLGFMPYFLKMTGINSAFVALFCGLLFLAQTLYLMKDCSKKAALQIMFGSFIYLPVVQIAFVLDKL